MTSTLIRRRRLDDDEDDQQGKEYERLDEGQSDDHHRLDVPAAPGFAGMAPSAAREPTRP